MKAEEAYSIKVASEITVAGGRAYFTVNWIEGNEYRSSIYSFDGKNQERVTFGGHEKKPAFQNGSLYYVSYTKEEETLFIIEGTREPRKLYSNKSIGKYIFVKDRVLAIVQDKVDKEAPFIAKKLKYRFDSQGYFRARKKLSVIFPEVKDLVNGDFDVVDVATNGSRVVFSATIEDDETGLQDVYDLNLSTSKYKRITTGKGTASSVGITDDGTVAYIGHRDGKKPWAAAKLIFPEEGKCAEIAKSASSSVGSDLFIGPAELLIYDKGSFYLIGQDGGSSAVYSYSRKASKLTGEKINIRSFDVEDGKLAYVYTSPAKPSVVVFGKELDLNPSTKGLVPKEMKVNGQDAWLIPARGKAKGTVVCVHGGPHTAYGYAYSIEFNYLANNSYNVLFGNPRGSSGYGEKFAAECVGDWGGKDFSDILAFMDAAVSRYRVEENFAITGGSYGGYMTNAAIVQTNRFKAAIAERCVSNLMSMCGTSDIGFWFNAIESGVKDPWSESGMRTLLEMSPITKAKNARTPTLFIHGEEDYRCPIEQSEQMFSALKLNGIETVLARYPGDSHEHARHGIPRNMLDRLQRKLDWLDQHMAGSALPGRSKKK
jgi:dipeptidyl aminopeptidase/acylaminoacyl peptidase